ncbi:hypothetical protein HDU99_003040, partial [Rhizoclosmatium hyalinum]
TQSGRTRISSPKTVSTMTVLSALPDRWNNPDVPAIIPNSINVNEKRSKRLLAVLSHPDVDIEPFKIVLEYIYCGTVKVPEELLKHVALIADQLLIPSLVSQCVKKIMDYTANPVLQEFWWNSVGILSKNPAGIPTGYTTEFPQKVICRNFNRAALSEFRRKLCKISARLFHRIPTE